MAFDAPALLSATGYAPGFAPLAARNAALDWAFYDIGNLSPAEAALLTTEINIEGSILVVDPNPLRQGVAVEKFEGFDGFRKAPGPMLRHFALAGVGSSDLGAAALARTLANHLGEPVGAIVAGYGAADLVAEAMGGWFFFGGANRLLAPAEPPTRALAAAILAAADLGREPAATPALDRRLAWDAATLLRLLHDPGRRVETLLGHSKGALTLSFALQIVALGDPTAFARLKATQVVTAGAVQPFPPGLGGVRQILGALDWFGELNSDPTVRRTLVPRAWHHLNTQTPAHLDLAAALRGAPD